MLGMYVASRGNCDVYIYIYVVYSVDAKLYVYTLTHVYVALNIICEFGMRFDIRKVR